MGKEVSTYLLYPKRRVIRHYTWLTVRFVWWSLVFCVAVLSIWYTF